MTDAKKLMNSALLRNLTDLRPITDNETRWSGKLYMLQRFINIRQDLMEVQDSDDGDLYIDTNQRLLLKTKTFVTLLTEINVIAKLVQTRKRILCECRDDLNMLLDAVEEENNDQDSPFFVFQLGNHYISSESAIAKHKHFENGVVKIQKGREQDLSLAEKAAGSRLKKRNNLTADEMAI